MAWYTGFIDGLSGIMRLGTRTSADQQSGVGNAAGEMVNDTTVMSLSAAWACINLLAGTIATLPLMVYKPVAGGREVAKDHWLYRILHDDPNEDQTAVDFWEYAGIALELRGNAYAEKLRGSVGQIVGLDPIPPGIVSKSRRADGVIEYRWTWDGKSRVETSENVLHIRGFGGDPMGGMSTLSVGAETFGHARGINRTASAVFRNAMRPSGVWQTATKLTPEQAAEVEARIAKKYQGAANAGVPLVMGHDLKWQQLTMSNADLEMLAARGFSVEEICRIFGVDTYEIREKRRKSAFSGGLRAPFSCATTWTTRDSKNRRKPSFVAISRHRRCARLAHGSRKRITQGGIHMEHENDLLTGCAAIAAHLGWTARQVKHRHENGELPTFTLGAGRIVYARRSTLAKHFEAQEKAARQ